MCLTDGKHLAGGSVQLQHEEFPYKVGIIECMHQSELNMTFLLHFTGEVATVSKVLYPLDEFIVGLSWTDPNFLELIDSASLRYRVVHSRV